MTNEAIGRSIASLRKESGLTQEQLAERLGVTNRSVSRWENGKTLPDLSLMMLLCQEFGISISQLLSGSHQPSNAGSREDFRLLMEYAGRKLQENTRQLRRIFLSGTAFLLLAFFTAWFPNTLFPRARVPRDVLPWLFLLAGIFLEGFGLCRSKTVTAFTLRQLDFMLPSEASVRMTTAEQLLSFASRHQSRILPQHRKAFSKIAEALDEKEYVRFSMIADSYQFNGNPGPWHIGLAVTTRRILLSGETMRGLVITGYDTDQCMLSDILSVQLSGRKILIRTAAHTISITAPDPDAVFPRLEAALKNAP